jgi:hypothetical protein
METGLYSETRSSRAILLQECDIAMFIVANCPLSVLDNKDQHELLPQPRGLCKAQSLNNKLILQKTSGAFLLPQYCVVKNSYLFARTTKDERHPIINAELNGFI